MAVHRNSAQIFKFYDCTFGKLSFFTQNTHLAAQSIENIISLGIWDFRKLDLGYVLWTFSIFFTPLENNNNNNKKLNSEYFNMRKSSFHISLFQN